MLRTLLPLVCLLVLLTLLAACGEDEDTPAPEPGPSDASDTDDDDGDDETAGVAAVTRAEDVAGTWRTSSVADEMWIVFREDGRYRYSGVVGTTTTTGPGGTNVASTDPWPWMKAHTGAWTFADGELTVTPDDDSIRPSLPFEWDAEESTLNLRVVGRSPTMTPWIVFYKPADGGDAGD